MRIEKSILLSVIFILVILPALAQKDYAFQVDLVTDNDAYYFMSNDQYYTNGLFLKFRYVPRNHGQKLSNKIIEFGVGHQIYNPYQAYIVSVDRIDRPFAGYLFLEAGVSRFYPDETVLTTDWQIGVLGPSARAEEVQSFIHRTLHLYETAGWEYQVHDAVGLNFHLGYVRSIKYFFNRHLDISWSSDLRLGTINSDVSIGLISRASIYQLRPLYNSSVTGSTIARATETDNDSELFLYFRPRISYVLYDATIQGGMFADPGPVTFEARPLKLYLETGVRGVYKNLVAGYSIIFYTRDADNDLIKNHLYASILVGCRF
jgi:hypothetical protein